MLPRFYAPDLTTDGEFLLPPEEATHLSRVLRLEHGARVLAFDGRGRQCLATVVDAGRDRALLRALEDAPALAQPRVPITVLQAILKGGSMDDAVRDATMMGAVEIRPVLSEHVDVKASVVRRDAVLERWRRVSLASVKQCGRATLPAIHPVETLPASLAGVSERPLVLFVEPSAGVSRRSVLALAGDDIPGRAAVALGPEGGWSPEELALLAGAGAIAVSLGPLTIRAESMPVAALAALAAVWP